MAGEEDLNPTAEPVPEGMEAWPEEDVRAHKAAQAGQDASTQSTPPTPPKAPAAAPAPTSPATPLCHKHLSPKPQLKPRLRPARNKTPNPT